MKIISKNILRKTLAKSAGIFLEFSRKLEFLEKEEEEEKFSFGP